MKSRHVVRRLVPVDFLDLDGLELWLEAMAAKGLHLLKFRALFAQFQPGEPARVRYHAEPTMERRRDAVSNPVPGCGELGWSYVGKIGYLALFRTADPDAPEFHTDPVTQSYTLDQLTRRLTRFVWLLLAMMAALTAFLVWARLDSSFGLVLDLVRYSSLYTSVVYLVDLALIIHFSWTVWGLCRLRRRLRAGIPHQRPLRWRHTGLVRQSYTLLLSISAFLQICSVIAYFAGVTRWDTELSTLDRPAPVLSLAELAGRDYTPEPFGYPGYEGPDLDNYVSYKRTPFSHIYEVDQSGTVNRGRCHLEMEWYDLTLPFLAEPLLEDLMDYQLYDLAYVPERYKVEELSANGFDRLVLAEDLDYGGQQLFARLGGRVVSLDYSGDGDLTDHLDQIAGLLRWDGQVCFRTNV